MRTTKSGLVLLAALAGLSTSGCNSTASRCEDFCKWSDDCVGDPASNCQDDCESKYDNASGSCQDAFDEFADCLSDNDLNCTKSQNSCTGGFSKFLVDCAGELD